MRVCVKLTKRNQERDRLRGQTNLLDDEGTGMDGDFDEEEEGEYLINDVAEEIGNPEVICEVGENTEGWVKESLIMDSGAAASFLRKDAPDNIPVNPVPESEKRRKWVNASGGSIRQTGISPVKFFTDSWAQKRMKLRRSDEVNKNIGSVSEVCDAGTICVFTDGSGVIVKDPDGALGQWLMDLDPDSTHFNRTGNIYTLPMWIPGPKSKAKKGDETKSCTAKKEKGKRVTFGGPVNSPIPAKTQAPAEGDWQRRDSKGRARAAEKVDDQMEVDIVLTPGEYHELLCLAQDRGYKSRSLTFSRLRH